MKAKKTPWWETAVLVVSFILVWAWFFARQARIDSATVWNGILLIAVVALVVVFVRRMKRTIVALRDQSGNFKN